MLTDRRILLVGPSAVRDRVAALLFDEGCRAVHLTGDEPLGRAVLAAAPTVDAVVLSGEEGGRSGAVLCAELRALGVAIPILVVLDEADEAVVACLEAGANDCITRPMRGRELAARLRAQLRLHDGCTTALLRIGPFVLHPARRIMEAGEGGRVVRLTATETAMLKFLYRAGGEAVPRPVLLRQVWGYSAGVTTHTIETHIYRLRRKMEPEAGRFALLVSDEDGYRLNMTWAPSPLLAMTAAASPSAG